MKLRIGNGYDIHRLVSGRPLILGGQRLDHPQGLGLDGHSDADVLVHAIMDALLGALSLGDIGRHFPPEDPRWKGADSLELLERVMELISVQGWTVINVDTVVVAERHLETRWGKRRVLETGPEDGLCCIERWRPRRTLYRSWDRCWSGAGFMRWSCWGTRRGARIWSI